MKFGPTRGNPLMIFEHFVKDFALLIGVGLLTLWKGPGILLDNTFLIAVAFISPFAVLVKYLTTRYSIDDEKMIIDSGFFVKKTMEIPLKSITTVDLSQNLLFQFFKVYKIKADNASQTNDSAKKAEVVLVLKKDLALYVKNLLESKKDVHPEKEEMLPEEQGKAPCLTCPVSDFLLLGVLQAKLLYIFTMISAVSGGFAYIFSLLFGDVDLTVLGEKLIKVISPAVAVIAFLLTAYILGVISSALLTAIRYYNFSVTNRKDSILLEFGLFTKKSYTLAKEKISGVTLKQSLLMRMFGYYTIDVFIIGYGDSGADNKQELSLLYPLAKLEQVDDILAQLLPEMTFGRNYHKPASESLRYFFFCGRMIFGIAVFLGTLIFALMGKTMIPFAVLLGSGFAVLALTVVSVYLEYRITGIYANREVVSVCRGIFTKQMTFVKTEKIESVSGHSTVWKEKKGITTIKLGFLAPLRVANISARNMSLPEYEEVREVLYL